MLLHEYLKLLRKSAGITQSHLSALLDMDQGAISHIESGKNGTTFANVDRWIQTCGGRLEHAPQLQSEAEKEMIGLFRATSPSAQAAILALLREAVVKK